MVHQKINRPAFLPFALNATVISKKTGRNGLGRITMLDAMHHKNMAQDAAWIASAPQRAPQQALQRTLKQAAACAGIGVHSGEQVRLCLTPAPADTGIVFIRTDLFNGARAIPARWDHVVDTRLSTVIANAHGGKVATIEHLMAALHAYAIDNAFIEIDGAEVPVMDGSADPFIALIEAAGIETQSAPRRAIEILRPVQVEHQGKTASLAPASVARYSLEISFDRAPIRTQTYDFVLSPEGFKQEIGRARTFGFFEEVDQLRKLGFARGGSLENAVVIKDDQVLNEGGLRFDDEFVRHKLLDAVGDLALAGSPLIGHFTGHCSGHELNNRLLHALFADAEAWRLA
jgi:UDP-3-O-[3-hydroxymyristoyl] N-acetylglucosamine deacetylase